MYQFVVHIQRENIVAQDLRITNPATGRREMIRANNPWAVRRSDWNGDNDSGDHIGAETWYCTDRATADILAKTLSFSLPGREILVLELRSVTQATANPPVVSLFTDKGLLPQ